MVLDLTMVLAKHLELQPLDTGQEKQGLAESLKAKAYGLATNCFCWTQAGDLVTGQMSGHVVVYNIQVSREFK